MYAGTLVIWPRRVNIEYEDRMVGRGKHSGGMCNKDAQEHVDKARRISSHHHDVNINILSPRYVNTFSSTKSLWEKLLDHWNGEGYLQHLIGDHSGG
jgi:hypothetical protein